MTWSEPTCNGCSPSPRPSSRRRRAWGSTRRPCGVSENGGGWADYRQARVAPRHRPRGGVTPYAASCLDGCGGGERRGLMTRPILVAGALVALSAPAFALCTANVAGTPQACSSRAPGRPRYRITRDEFGVPHIKARSLYDVGYATGIAQAEDRLFQMEFVRKSATGNLAEIAGRDQLGSDEDTRRQFYTEEERTYLFSTLSCDVQTMVRGFVDGVNAHIAEIYGDATLARVPHEFFFLPTVIRIQGNDTIPSGVRYTVETIGGREVLRPDAWRTTDVLAIGALLAGRFGSGGGRQLQQAALLNYLTALFTRDGAPAGQTPAEAAADVFEDVRWLNDPKAPTTIPTGAVNPVRGGHTPEPLASAAPARVPALLDGLRTLLSERKSVVSG